MLLLQLGLQHFQHLPDRPAHVDDLPRLHHLGVQLRQLQQPGGQAGQAVGLGADIRDKFPDRLAVHLVLQN